MTVSAMKEILVQFVQDELIASRPESQECFKNPPRAGRNPMGVNTTNPPKERCHVMNHIRTIVGTAAAAAVLASGLGLAAVGVAGSANAAVCWEQWSDGSYFYYYC
jgi:hypothetical protein